MNRSCGRSIKPIPCHHRRRLINRNLPRRKSRSPLAERSARTKIMSKHGRGERQVRWWVLLGLVVLLSAHSLADAQIKIEVPERGGAGIPIAISPLKNLGGEGQRLGETFADVIARDLDLSGYFKVIDRGAYIEGLDPLSPEEINFQNWSLLGALALVKGGFSLDGDTLTIEVRLFDVAQRKQLGGKRYRGERKDVRRMAHRFADQIMLMLTGELGPFSAKIAFVSNRNGRAKELFWTDLTGTDITQVTKDYRINLGPSWNPSGT